MKKTYIIILVCLSLILLVNMTQAQLSEAWKRTNSYTGGQQSHGIGYVNDSVIFTGAQTSGAIYKWEFSDNSTFIITTTNTWGPGTSFGNVRGVTVTPDGYVVTADNTNNRLLSWDLNLNPYRMGIELSPAGSNGRIYGLSSDTAGNIYINHYIFQFDNLTTIGHKRVEIYPPPSTWNSTQLTPLQSFDVDTLNGGGYIWEGSVTEKDGSSVFIAARVVNKIYKYSGSIGSGYSPDPLFTTVDIHDDPYGAYGFRNISLTPDESRLVATYNAYNAQDGSPPDTTAIYFFDAVYGDLLPTSSVFTAGANLFSPSIARILSNDTEMIMVNIFDSPTFRLQRGMSLVPNSFLPATEVWANETTIQFSVNGGDGSANYSLQEITGTATLSPTGLFTPTGPGRVIVVVEDTSGNLDSSNSIPIRAVTITPGITQVAVPGQQILLTAGGDGIAPFTWSVSSATLGSFSNQSADQVTFTAGPETGDVTVTVTDTNGHQASVLIQVIPTSAPLIQDELSFTSDRKDIIRFEFFE